MKVFLDDMHVPDKYVYGLKDPSEWTVARTAKAAYALVSQGNVTELHLDHDLGGKYTGYDLMKWIMEDVYYDRLKTIPTFHVHSNNPVGAENMRQIIKTIGTMVKTKGR